MARRGTQPGELEQPAVVLEDSTLRIGPSSRVLGGSFGSGPMFAYTAQDPATCTVEMDPRATVENINIITAPQPTPTHFGTVFHSWIVAGEDYGVAVAGPENGFALLALGSLLHAPVPTLFGETLIDLATMQPVELFALPSPEGCVQRVYNCPATAPVATPFVFQALTLSPSGAFGRSIPSPLTVAWPQGVLPQTGSFAAARRTLEVGEAFGFERDQRASAAEARLDGWQNGPTASCLAVAVRARSPAHVPPTPPTAAPPRLRRCRSCRSSRR